MDKKDTSSIFESLKTKVEKLFIKHNEAKDSLKILKEENILLQEKLILAKVQTKELSESYKALKLAKSLSGKDGKSTDIKLKINELIREIDKCIAQVNN